MLIKFLSFDFALDSSLLRLVRAALRMTGSSMLLISTFGLYCAQYPNLITDITAEKNKLKIIPAKNFAQQFLLEPHFFAEFDENVDISVLDDSVLIIPFVAVAAPIIWGTNSYYSIPSIDADYYAALQRIKKAYQILYPSLSWSGEIVPEKIVKNAPANNGDICGVLFSGGLDAVCTSFANLDKQQRLITICGGDIRPMQEHMWQQVQKQAIEFAQQYKHTNSFVRSNFLTMLHHDYLNTISPEIPAWWAHTSQSMSYCGLVAPLMVALGYNRLLIASTRTVEYPYAYGTHPIIDNCINYAGVQIIHDGAELDRMAKVQLIERVVKTNKLQIPVLRVCWGNDMDGGNCCECEKCLRTINELIVEGADHQAYGFAVSLDTVIQRTKKYFKPKLSMKAGLWWHWGCVLKRIIERFEQENNQQVILYPQKLRNYLWWLSRVDLDGIGSNREKYIVREQQRLLLQHLWLQSLVGTPCF